MLKAINKERRKNDDYREQLPILIERLQYLSEACIKKEELIKTQGEYMQSSESQIYELQMELRQKDLLIRELNKTIIEQRDYLEKNTYDNSDSVTSFDSKLDGSTTSKRRRRRGDKNSAQSQREEDLETIDGLKDDIKQLLKEYKLIEKQKDDIDGKYQDLCKKNEDLVREILNMEQVIEDQDQQIMSMREKLQNQLKEITHNNVFQKNLYMMNNQLNPALDYTETDLNKSANISQQITLENFKAGRIGPREPKNKKKKVDRKALKDALNLSYQIINPEGERREQSMIEDRIVLRKSRGISPFGVSHGMNALVNRNKEGNNTDSTTAEGNSKGNESNNKFLGRNRLHSIGDFDSKQSQSIMLSKRKMSNLMDNPEPQIAVEPLFKPEIKRGHVKNQESVVTLMGDKIQSPEVFKKMKEREENELSFKAQEENEKADESMLLRKTMNKLAVDPINHKPEISALNLNESQFNFAEDSQMNDIIEVSHFAKPSEIGRFLEGNDDGNEHELAKRFRKYKPEESDNQRKSDKNTNKLEELANDIKNTKQNIFKEPENFPDLDTSDIAFEAPHHFDKEFGDKDNSFTGSQEHNSFEAEINNDIFNSKGEPFMAKDFKPLSTPQVGKSKGKFTFPEEIEEFNLKQNKNVDSKQPKNIMEISEEVKISEMKGIAQLENKYSIILADDQDKNPIEKEKPMFVYENKKKQDKIDKNKKNQNAFKKEVTTQPYKMEIKQETKKEKPMINNSDSEENDKIKQIKASIINFDDEEDLLPTNKRIKEVLNFDDKRTNKKVVSIVDDFENDGDNDSIKNNKIMESLKSSILSSNSEFSNCDKISERMADIITMKDERKEDIERNIEGRKRGHKKNVLTMNRILPAPGEIENYLAVRSPPEEEFFLMTLMCYKLNHQHFCKICDINGQKLFMKASKDMKLPFFKFPDFIEKELDTAYLNLIYQKRKKKHMQKTPKKLTPLQKKQRLRVKQVPAEESRGKVLDDDYDIDDEYF